VTQDVATENKPKVALSEEERAAALNRRIRNHWRLAYCILVLYAAFNGLKYTVDEGDASLARIVLLLNIATSFALVFIALLFLFPVIYWGNGKAINFKLQISGNANAKKAGIRLILLLLSGFLLFLAIMKFVVFTSPTVSFLLGGFSALFACWVAVTLSMFFVEK
jgi:hypothetical protein